MKTKKMFFCVCCLKNLQANRFTVKKEQYDLYCVDCWIECECECNWCLKERNKKNESNNNSLRKRRLQRNARKSGMNGFLRSQQYKNMEDDQKRPKRMKNWTQRNQCAGKSQKRNSSFLHLTKKEKKEWVTKRMLNYPKGKRLSYYA